MPDARQGGEARSEAWGVGWLLRAARARGAQRGGAWRLPAAAAAAASAWDTARVSFIDLEFWSWSCTLHISHLHLHLHPHRL
jgi:hypothetical protein